MTKISGKGIVKVKFNARKYAGLLAESLPTVIESEVQNRRMLKTLKGLMDKGENLTPEERELAKLLGHLIQEFEQRFYKPESTTPREALIELMNANNLKQADIVHLFGSRGITSEIINGKREISKANVKALAEFFHVSTDVFI
ncbi:MAG: transcriptional regulator [Blastocatellia bacterium]|nr:transcriptional regulator [Blastocatellia bacterium]